MSFFSVLVADAKKDLKAVGSVITKAAPIAQFVGQMVGLGDPALGTAIETTANVVLNVETQFATIGAETGTGAQKSAAVLAIVGPYLTKAIAAAGSAAAGKSTQTVVDEICDLLNTDPQLFVQIGQLAAQFTGSSTTAAAATA